MNSGKLYSDLFNKRQEADYKDFMEFNEKDIQPLMTKVQGFINETKQLIHH